MSVFKKASVYMVNNPNAIIWTILGERESMGTPANGEDIWRGVADIVPVPIASGEQMYVVSSNSNDTNGGTGVNTVEIDYLAPDGSELHTTVAMNGTTPVALTPPLVRFINGFHATEVGSNGVSLGNITIYKSGAASTIYSLIALGGNESMLTNRMIPLGKKLILKGWHAEEAQGKRVTFRIRSTDRHGVLVPNVYLFKGTAYLNKTTSGNLPLFLEIPPLSRIKISGWGDAAGAEGSCGYWGELIDA